MKDKADAFNAALVERLNPIAEECGFSGEARTKLTHTRHGSYRVDVYICAPGGETTLKAFVVEYVMQEQEAIAIAELTNVIGEWIRDFHAPPPPPPLNFERDEALYGDYDPEAGF